MNTLIKKTPVIIILMALFLMAASPAAASKPDDLAISLDLYFTGPDTAAGTFTASGVVNDSGSVIQQFTFAGHTAHGLKTLESSKGSILIRFDVRMSPSGPTTAVAEGRFVVLSGTGEYANLRAVGSTFIEADFVTGTLTGSYAGTGHYDPK
jgi:hypothetical protein